MEGNKVYFTSNTLADQWGDDWNDAPINCNASSPYLPTVYHYANGTSKLSSKDWNDDGTPKYQLLSVFVEYPGMHDYNDWTQTLVASLDISVETVNSKKYPWIELEDPENLSEKIQVFAGITFPEFESLITREGGLVYVPSQGVEAAIFPKSVENPQFNQ